MDYIPYKKAYLYIPKNKTKLSFPNQNDIPTINPPNNPNQGKQVINKRLFNQKDHFYIKKETITKTSIRII